MKKNIIVGVGTGLIILLLFYWFQIRPSEIKSACMRRFYDLCKTSTLGNDKCVKMMQIEWSSKLNLAYQACLHEKGL